ncbi:Beauvericin cluster-specific repressor BEA4 [Paramyrothecium foliicola]|nr:Beauvericin cluster-specific repressor BEA4 [Paramyrothecium foliicola]
MNRAPLHATACKGCRRRGRKCDRTLPTCMSCERRGIVCEGYVTRWPGVAARGKLAGKSIPVGDSLIASSVSRAGRSRGAAHADPVPGPSGRHEHAASLNDSRQSVAGRLARHDPSPDNSSLVDTLLSAEEDGVAILIKHCTHIEDLSTVFYLGNGPSDNPLFRYVLPLVDNVPPVRYAIAASASCHLAARTLDEALERKSLQLRVRATHLLRQKLRDQSEAPDQSILASILMLAQLDMCSGDCTEFETHLRAAATVIRGQHIDHSENRYFFEQRLAWLNILGSTTSKQLPILTVEELKTALSRFSSNGIKHWTYDVFPCPIDLVELIVDVTMLYKKQPNRTDLNQADLKQAEYFMTCLAGWKWLQDCSGPRQHMIEVWRLGIMAYLRRLFPSTSHMVDAATLTKQVLYHADLIPPASSWGYSLLWPIFQIGVTLDEEATREREWIKRRLNLALQAVGCRHFSNAIETLDFAWNNNMKYDPLTVSTDGRTIMLG